MRTKKYAVAGATGMVGRTLLSILHDRGVPASAIFALGRHHSSITYGDDEITLHALDAFDFTPIDIAFFALDNDLAARYIPKATAQGAFVIDKSSHYRLDADVPLMVPSVNGHNVHAPKRIISNPNCSVIPLVSALHPLHQANPIKRAVVATYQSVSGAGKDAMERLNRETKQNLMGASLNLAYTPDNTASDSPPLAFNVIPHIDDMTPSGYTKEELKLIQETHKILGIPVSTTCVRVPVFIGHSMAVHLEFSTPPLLKEITQLLKKSGCVVDTKGYHTPQDVQGTDHVYISRLRMDTTVENGCILWVVADNLRIGAALNGIHIAQHLIQHHPDLLKK